MLSYIKQFLRYSCWRMGRKNNSPNEMDVINYFMLPLFLYFFGALNILGATIIKGQWLTAIVNYSVVLFLILSLLIFYGVGVLINNSMKKSGMYEISNYADYFEDLGRIKLFFRYELFFFGGVLFFLVSVIGVSTIWPE